MKGIRPKVSITAEVRNIRDDLREIWISNTGEYRPATPISIDLTWSNAQIRAYDTLAGYSGTMDMAANRMILKGPPPALDKPVMAGWFVVAPENANAKALLKAGTVEIEP